jgi:hypothetical protein
VDFLILGFFVLDGCLRYIFNAVVHTPNSWAIISIPRNQLDLRSNLRQAVLNANPAIVIKSATLTRSRISSYCRHHPRL